MLMLSVLIIMAMAVAVASFLVDDSGWLLFISLVLVALAFYVSRRAARGVSEPEVTHSTREHLTVTIDNQVAGLDPTVRVGPSPSDRDDRFDTEPEAGRAIAS